MARFIFLFKSARENNAIRCNHIVVRTMSGHLAIQLYGVTTFCTTSLFMLVVIVFRIQCPVFVCLPRGA
jgi:hypothetical protein